jgi:hypothetical protein
MPYDELLALREDLMPFYNAQVLSYDENGSCRKLLLRFNIEDNAIELRELYHIICIELLDRTFEHIRMSGYSI